ncbi:MAG: hypothetical protein HDT26_04615 [Subdoligranulum sp.]|nr:hypothetical protein [Subdoligranulum sp.]
MKNRKIVSLLLAGSMTTALLAAPAQAAETPTPKSESYTISASHWIREDYSQEANPSVFTGVYSRDLYNTIRQTMAEGTSEDPAYTMVSKEDYSAVKKLIGRMEGVLRYEHHVPQNFTNYWQYLDYFAVSAEMPENYQAPLDFIQPAIQATAEMTDRKTVEYFNDYIRSLLAYEKGKTAGITQTFAPPRRGTESRLRFLRQSDEVPLRRGGHPLLHHQQQDPHLEPCVCGRPVAPCGCVRQRPLRQERSPAH